MRTNRAEINRLRRAGLVEYAVPDRTVNVDAVQFAPDDPLWTNQYDMSLIGMPAAWIQDPGGSGVVVAVIDTGIDFTHPDLAPNLYRAPHGSHGWQCYGGVLTEGGADVYGHGTHCAGTIAALGNNGIGIAGMDWQVRVESFAFLGSTGSGQISDALELMDKIIELKTNGVNICVASCSWGGLGAADPSLVDGFAAMESAGILSCCAAGNSALNIDLNPFEPGGQTNAGILCVAASDQNDHLAYFSDYGLLSVDIAAPGYQIWSTLSTNRALALSSPTGYGRLSGTSMATPHVAALAARIKALNPRLTVPELKTIILDRNSYDPMQDFNGTLTGTGGRINVYKASNNPLVLAPKTNLSPVVQLIPGQQTVYGGSPLALLFSGSDPDGDPLRHVVYDASSIIPYTETNYLSTVVPYYAVDTVLNLFEGVLDGNGGADLVYNPINLLRNPSFSPAPFGITSSATVTNNISYVSAAFTSTAPAVRAKFRTMICSRWAIREDWFSPIPSTAAIPLIGADIFRVEVIARDSELVQVQGPLMYLNNGSTNTASVFPRLALSFDRFEGTVPLQIHYNATNGSYLPHGFGSHFFIQEFGASGVFSAYPAAGSLTLTNPGMHELNFYYYDPVTGYPDGQTRTFIALAPTNSGRWLVVKHRKK